MWMEGTRRAAQQRVVPEPRAQISAEVWAAQDTLFDACYLQRVATRLSEILGHDGHLTDVAGLDYQDIVRSEMNSRSFAMPLFVHEEGAPVEVDLPTLDVQRLHVA